MNKPSASHKLFSSIHRNNLSSAAPSIFFGEHFLSFIFSEASQEAPRTIAGRSPPDKPYYERRRTTHQARGRPGTQPERRPIRRLKGRHTCLNRMLTLAIDFLQLPPPLPIELAAPPPSEQARLPALQGKKGVWLRGSRDMLTYHSGEAAAE